jgi:hypothetical protein
VGSTASMLQESLEEGRVERGRDGKSERRRPLLPTAALYTSERRPTTGGLPWTTPSLVRGRPLPTARRSAPSGRVSGPFRGWFQRQRRRQGWAEGAGAHAPPAALLSSATRDDASVDLGACRTPLRRL